MSLEGVITRLAARLGHRLDDEVTARYRRGLEAVAQKQGLGLSTFVGLLDAGLADAWDAAVDAGAVHETYFFRDPGQLAVLAAAARAALHDGRPYARALSVGCSTGEEAYSLGVLLGAIWPAATVQGFDVSPRALDVARLGAYGARAAREVDLRLVSPDVFVEESGARVGPRLKAAVRFAPLNLADFQGLAQLGPKSADVVVCRNVLMYLKPGPMDAARQALVEVVRPGGCLVVGPFDFDRVPDGFRACDLGAFKEPAVTPLERALRTHAARVGGSVLLRELKPTPFAAATTVALAVPVTAPHSAATAKTLAHAQTLADSGQHQAALQALDALGDEAAVQLLKGKVLLDMGELGRAELCLRRVLLQDPNSPDAAFHLLLVMSQRGEKDFVQRLARQLSALLREEEEDHELAHGLTTAMVRQTLARLGLLG